MKLTTYTDFGLRVLMYLACLPPEEKSSVADIANRYQVSRNHMVKVVSQLVALGYLHSQRGKNGGITLAKSPKKINIGKVIRELEHNLNGIDCNSPGCRLIPGCQLIPALRVGMEAFLTAMEAYTLADLVGQPDELIALLTPAD